MNKRFLNLMLDMQKGQGFLYRLILSVNELCIRLFLSRQVGPAKDYSGVFSVGGKEFVIKALGASGPTKVCDFFKYSIKTENSDYVMPHKTDIRSIEKIFKLASHIPLGIFHDDDLIGYALIRLLFPRKASYAIFISEKWQGKGIGTASLEKQLDLIRQLQFEPHSAVSKKNTKSLKMLKKLGIEYTGDLGDYFEVKDRSRA